MKQITLGTTGITVPQNGFGALPIQRDDMDTAIAILRRAYEGGMRFFDTARAYSDSEEKMGRALADDRKDLFISTKTASKNPDDVKKDLDTSLKLLKTDYIDIYQFHQVSQCYKPGDGTGMYETLLDAKEQGMIRHIGVTSHKLQVAFECIESGLYETLQFPFSYLSSEKELGLVKACEEKNMGFIAMKGLAGGLINKSKIAMAFMLQFSNVIPIWGVQRMSEMEEWLSYFENTPEMNEEIQAYIDQEKKELSGDFCRGCGYCMPCPAGIEINNCARMSLLLRRSPSARWLEADWQEKMKQIEQCKNCGACRKKCPYELDTPNLLKKNYEDYRQVVAGAVSVN